MATYQLSEYLAQAFKEACLAEVTALKPGNVHIFADGHGMAVQDFIASADVAAPPICRTSSTLGQRILDAVGATRVTVGCNTNLGILLLSAPLIQAFESGSADLQAAVKNVLAASTVEDARLVYQAIQLASPGGLGASAEYDVSDEPNIPLLAAMQLAQHRDLIAMQYANGFEQIFAFGVPQYQSFLNAWDRPAWAVTGLYLSMLTAYPDTHITRKFNQYLAEEVSQEAGQHLNHLSALGNPKLYQKELLAFDQSLKTRGINPGTSADMTVATLLAFNLINQHS